MSFSLNLHLKSERYRLGFALVRQCREQATAGRTHASMSVRGHALHRNPGNIGTVALHRNPENIGTVAQHWAGKIHVRRTSFNK